MSRREPWLAWVGVLMACVLLASCRMPWHHGESGVDSAGMAWLEQSPEVVLRETWSFCPHRMDLIGPLLARRMGEIPPEPAWVGLDLEYRIVRLIASRHQRRSLPAQDVAGLVDLARFETELLPDSAQVHRALGLALLLDGQTREASLALDRAQELEAASPYTVLARMLVDIAQSAGAAALLNSLDEKSAASRASRLPGFWLIAAWAAEMQGDPRFAENAYRRAMRLDQHNTAAMVGLARLEMDMTQTRALAAERLAQVLVINEADEVALFNLALIRMREGRYDQAMAPARMLLGVAPEDPAAWELNGLILRGRGHVVEAEAAIRRATELDPFMAGAFFNLGLVCAEQLADPACATEAFARYLDLQPEGARAEQVRSWLRKQPGNHSQGGRP